MKRKVVGLLIALAVATCMGGCTDQSTVGEGDRTQSESQAESKEGNGSGETLSGNQEADLTRLAGHPLWGGYGTSKLYSIDASGKGIREYSWDNVCASLKKKGFDLKDASVMAMSDGIAYCYLQEAVGQGYQINVFAVDLNAEDVTKVWSVEPGCNLESLDFYKNTLYATYYSYENGNISEKEKAFEKVSGKLEYQEKESLSQDFYRGINGYSTLFFNYAMGEGIGDGCSMSRILDQCGYVIGRQDDQYKMVDKDGMVKVMSSMPDSYVYIDSYDANYVIYHDYDDNWNSVLMVLDCGSGEVRSVEGDADFLDYEDGKLYYCEDESDHFVLKKNCIYQMDLESGAVTKIYEMESVPGATDIQPGTEWFQLVDGRIFFQKIEGNACKWFRVNLDGSKATFQDLGCTVSEFDVFRYGQVIHDSLVLNCEFCGIPLEKYYGEAFQLSSQYSSEYQKINETLAERLQNTIQSYHDISGEQATDEMCEEHLEFPQMYCETVEDYVSTVRIFQDHYLVIDTKGYWYGGGAHGQPYMGQYLFDLTTGEQKGLKDFYKGSEEDFKKLVARKTKEDFENYDEYQSPYYTNDADDIYDTAYQYASLDSSQVIFEEEGVNIVYQPYEMGPYASGFITIWISYQEFLGREGL